MSIGNPYNDLENENELLKKELEEKEEELRIQKLVSESRRKSPHARYTPEGNLEERANPLGVIIVVGFILCMLYILISVNFF